MKTLAYNLAMTVSLALAAAAPVRSATHHAGPGKSIQEVIDAANAGDTIIVAAGEYEENVLVNKSLTIRSENGSAETWVRAADPGKRVFEVRAHSVTISGFTVTGATGATGIYVRQQDGCEITDNIANGNYQGIYLYRSHDGTVSGNTASNNTISGITVERSDRNALTDNTASNNRHGIAVHQSSENTLTSNTLSNNTHGIYMERSSRNVLMRNTVSDNRDGIRLSESVANVLTNNNVSHNRQDGIYLYKSSENIITINTIANNDFAICQEDSSGGNAVHHNSICGNVHGIFNDFLGASYRLNAACNWWGDASGPSGGVADPVTATSAEGTGDGVSTNVRFYPWLSGPFDEPKIDIDPKVFNLQAQGEWITTYIRLPDGYAVEDIVIENVRLLCMEGDKSLDAEYQEVQRGVLMVVVKFDWATAAGWFDGLHDEEVNLTVTGGINGVLFEATDTIRVIDSVP